MGTGRQRSSHRSIQGVKLIETRANDFLDVLERGTVSTNVFLRRLHNFACDKNWILRPVLLKRQWPQPRFQDKRATTLDEHKAIVQREPNTEKQAFYELAWHLGASQSDLANLRAENIDRKNRVISFERMKVRWRRQQPCLIAFGGGDEAVLKKLPDSGPLFPTLMKLRAADRATYFKRRCALLGISGVTLHSYRYSWAERAKEVGYPERFAQQALGHNSKAVHRAYAKGAQFKLPALEDFVKSVGLTDRSWPPEPRRSGGA